MEPKLRSKGQKYRKIVKFNSKRGDTVDFKKKIIHFTKKVDGGVKKKDPKLL